MPQKKKGAAANEDTQLKTKLTGITSDSTEAEIADAVFPVITTDGKRYFIRIQGQNIIAKKATNCIMSLAVLMTSDFALAPPRTPRMAVPYSTTARNENRVHENHLDICLSFSKK